VEPTTPCANKTTKEEKLVNQQVISGRIIFTECWLSGNSRRSIISTSRIQVSTLCRGGSSTNFTMEGQDPTIRLPYFRGDGLDDPKNHLFICENIWVENHIIDKDTKVS
jgi:hypothetical protein